MKYNVLYFIMMITLGLAMVTGLELLYRISVLFILLICIKNGIKESKLINPYLLFSIVPFSLLIYHNIGSFYMIDLTSGTWLLAIINMLAFMIGMEKTKGTCNYQLCKGVGTDFYSLRSHALALTIIGTIPYFYYIATKSLFPLASIVTLFTVPGLMCAICSKRKLLIFVCIAIIISPMIIGNTSKSSVLTIVLALLIAYDKFYVEVLKDRKKLILLCALGVVLMFVSFSFANKDRGAYNAQEGLEQYEGNGVEWNYDAGLHMPYMYLTTPWSNLQYVIETQDTRTYGLWAIKPILGYLQIDDVFKEEYEMSAFSSFNTFTFIAIHYKDFGFWGSIILSLFLGFFVKKVYSLYIMSASPLDIATYVLVSQAVLEMFFSNHFFGQSYPFTIVILMWLYKNFICPNKPIQVDSSYE